MRIERGFTFIELIIGIAAVSFIGVSVLVLLSQTVKFVQIKKIEAEAAYLATEEMERIRNLPYNDIGTIGGIPSGVLSQNQTTLRGVTLYNIKTNVRYVDDSFDGTISSNPQDLLNTDYKQVKITISWDTVFDKDSMFFLTIISPKGIETTMSGGTLKITVFDANGSPVPQAEVNIINQSVGVNLNNIETNNNGVVIFPGAPESIENYQISVAKIGYSSARTYGINDPIGNNSPSPIHLSIFTNQTTEIGFKIDRTSALQITTKLLDGSPISAQFNIHGSIIIGYDNNDAPIYKYTNTAVTDPVSGSVILNPIESDSYTIAFDGQAIGYNIIEYNPPLNPVPVLPNNTVNIAFVLYRPYSVYSLLVNAKNINGEPFSSININLIQNPDFNQTKTTGLTGQAFFDNLSLDNYEMNITVSGYAPVQLPITINGNNEETVQLSPI